MTQTLTPRTLKLTLDVTDELIAKGKKWDCCQCPIALAISNALANVIQRSIYVGSEYIKFEVAKDNLGLPEEYTAFTPPIATAFIDRFDSPDRTTRPPLPIKFDLFAVRSTVPEPSR